MHQIEASPHVLKLLEGFIAFSGNPDRTEAVFDIADGLRQTDLYEQFIDYAHSQPTISQIVHERYFAPMVNLEGLIEYPQNSLGHQYAAEMRRTGLKPDFYRNLKIEDDYSYLAMRMRQTHDIWHIITGFGTDLAGESALQAFTLAQMRSPLAIALLGAFVVHVMRSGESLNPLFAKIQKGWMMGETSHPFIAQRWEESWEKPVSEWRAEINCW